MRVKSAERRRAIIQAAASVFREKGFERASMDAIAAGVGGSKSTLYNYFPTKEELFFAVVEDAFEAQAEAPFYELVGPGGLRERLARFARLYLDFRLDEDVIALDRMLIAEAERSELGNVMHARYVQPQLRRLAETLKAEMEAGRIRRANPHRAATQFRLLAEGDLIERRLRGETSLAPEAAENELAEGVETFLRAYAVDENPGSAS